MSSTLSIHDVKSIHVERNFHNGTSWTEISLRAHNHTLFEIHAFGKGALATITVAENTKPPEWHAIPQVLLDVLADIEQYLDERADCDQPSGSAPNENPEMVLLCRLRKARKVLP